MSFGEAVTWESGNRKFSMVPQGHLWRFTETRTEKDRKTGEVKEKEFELGLIPGGIYCEVARLVRLAGLP